MLADQDPTFLERMHRLLVKVSGIAVVGKTTSATQALALVIRERPDAVLLGTELDGGSALDLLRQIKGLASAPTVIMMSSDSSHESRLACSRAGSDFFFDKATEERKAVNMVRLLSVPRQNGPEHGKLKPGS
ncbi:MAG TPA: response regulator [Nitrospiraceae bacterium]